MNLNLKGKKALVTGGSKGIGLAIKKALEKEGIEVISWSRSEGIDLLKTIPKVPDVDILINNFGGGGTWKPEDADIVMYKNYGITQKITREWLNYNKSQGRVITITSVYGTYPGNNPEFASAKSSQIMFMKSMSLKYPGITFNCISPTEVSDAGTPKKVSLKSEDIANLVVFLCSNKAKFITGQNIVIGESNAFWNI